MGKSWKHLERIILVGNLGAAMIRGFQQNDFTGTEKVIACAKHMIAEESINGLNAAPIELTIRTLRRYI